MKRGLQRSADGPLPYLLFGAWLVKRTTGGTRKICVEGMSQGDGWRMHVSARFAVFSMFWRVYAVRVA